MKIGIFHGYELSGSGSNQSTRYLVRALVRNGHEVHIICREPSPEKIDFVDKAIEWDEPGNAEVLFQRIPQQSGICILHKLPIPPINAVYITDTQRPGNVKAFTDLSNEELEEYHRFVVDSLRNVLTEYPMDILHCNHVVYQPVAAAEAVEDMNIPFIIYPRGSAMEYTLRHDQRYQDLALNAASKAAGLISGNEEVISRFLSFYPGEDDEILAKTEIVGLGVDTSLFKPVQKAERERTVKKLNDYSPFNGKSTQLSKELFLCLDKGEIGAIKNYKDTYQIKQPDSDLIKKLEKIPWQKNILTFVGALISGKGLQTLIASMPFILKKIPDTHLIIVGSGIGREVFEAFVHSVSTKNEALLDELINYGFDYDPIEINGPWKDIKSFLSVDNNRSELFNYGTALSEHVHFLGRLDHELLRFIFPCSDIAFFPSIVPEAYGNVLFESLSSGVFPMASYFSGLACGIDSLATYLDQELVDLMKIPVDDVQRLPGLIENVVTLLTNKIPERISSDLRNIAVENMDWNIRADEMVCAYSNFIYEYKSKKLFYDNLSPEKYPNLRSKIPLTPFKSKNRVSSG